MSRDLSQPLGVKPRAFGIALIAVVTLVAYWPALSGALVYDDLYIIGQNPTIQSFANLSSSFARSYWDFLDAETASRVGYYRPLTSVLLTIGYALGDGRPGAFHALSILFHLLASLAAWLFAARLVRSERIGFWAAILFALHPIHVESVAWISALNDPLFALFGLLSLAAFVRWRDQGSRGLPWVAGLWLLPALFSKEAAIAIVPVALAADVARRRAGGDERGMLAGLSPFARAYLPFLAAGLAWYAARAATFGDLLAGFDRTTTDFGVSFGRLALLRVEILGGALELLAWPRELNLFRPFRPELPAWDATLMLAGLWSAAAAAAVVLLWRGRGRNWLGLFLIVPAGLLPVVLRVTSLGTFPLSDRFLYLPAFGFVLLAASFVLRRLPRPAATIVLCAVCAAYGARTFVHTFTWHDEEALFRTAVAQNPRNPNVHWGLGRVMLTRYTSEGVWEQLAESRACFERSMDLLELASGAGDEKDLSIFATQDDHLQTNLGLGWTYVFEAQYDPFHDYETARVIFQRVVLRYPWSERGYVGLGVTLMLQGDLEGAGARLREALRINPRSPEAHHNMARVLHRLEDWDGAERHFREAMKYRAGNLGDLVGLARTLELSGDLGRAYELARSVLDLHPDSGDLLVILGSVCASQREYSEALRWLDRAVGREPANGAAHLRRGVVLMAMGQRPAAAEALKEACRLMPDSFDAHYNLGALLLEQTTNAQQLAMPYLMVAYRTRSDDLRGRELRKRLLALDIVNPDYLFALGSADADKGLHELALGWAERALERDPDHGPSHFLVGLILKQPKELSEEAAQTALEHLQRGAALMPDSYQAQYEYAELLVRAGRGAEALPVMIRALELLEKEPMKPAAKKEIADGLREAIELLQAK